MGFDVATSAELPDAMQGLFSETGKGALSARLVRLVEDHIRVSYLNVISKCRARWNKAELSFYAQIDEREIEALKNDGIPVFDDPFVLPLLHTYIGSTVAAEFQLYTERDPRIALRAVRETHEKDARKMELCINNQYQRARGDLTRLHRLVHAKMYGYSPRKTVWDDDKQMNVTYP